MSHSEVYGNAASDPDAFRGMLETHPVDFSTQATTMREFVDETGMIVMGKLSELSNAVDAAEDEVTLARLVRELDQIERIITALEDFDRIEGRR